MKKLLSVLSIVVTLGSVTAEETTASIFTNIYEQKMWGMNDRGEGTSGKGSVFENSKEYVAFLKGFLATHSCRTVVEIGCGDWELAKHIDWASRQYRGYDVVQKVISKNITTYGASNIRFICADGIFSETPDADLLICKDVLEHLPNYMVFSFLNKLPDYKYCLITNDISICNSNAKPNGDCPIGGYRPLDLTIEPFNLKATPVLTYHCAGTIKQVLLVERK